MRRSMLAGIALCLALDAAAAGPEPEPWVLQSRLAAQRLGGRLMDELTKALADSPPAAIRMCSERAPVIAAEETAGLGATIGRTALRVRNPANAPAEWQRRGLEEFARRIAAGEDPAALEFAEVVTVEGATERRWMKPIVTAPRCLACHGTDLAPGVAEAVAERYPEDQARGFAAGELRGAFYALWRGPPAK